MDELTDLRGQIDEIDGELIGLFNRRMAIAKKVAEVKHDAGLPVFNRKREQEILCKIEEQTDEGIKSYAKTLFHTLFDVSRAYQSRIIAPESLPNQFHDNGIGKYGLLGEKLGHSHSPEIHSILGNTDYQLFAVGKNDLDAFMRTRNFAGINVTIPHKQDVTPYCDFLSGEAHAIGSVNTIVRKGNKLYGHNTDCFGLSALIDLAGVSLNGKKVLILGSGGTSLTAQYVAKSRKAEQIIVVSRHGKNNYGNMSEQADADAIINTTPVGMYPDNGKSPIDLSVFENLSGVIDVVYNPIRSALVMDAAERGITALGGLAMLVNQAWKAHQLFFEGSEPLEVNADYVYKRILEKVSNIILVGMPGSGKTTVGRLVAERLNRPFIDTDEEIVKRAGRPIPEIFARDGEDGFRRIESEVISDVCKESGGVISVGGGGVMRAENRGAMRQNGIIIHLTRPVEMLRTEGRPLSKSIEDLREMLGVRAPVYGGMCDFAVDNTASVGQAVDDIIRRLDEQ